MLDNAGYPFTLHTEMSTNICIAVKFYGNSAKTGLF